MIWKISQNVNRGYDTYGEAVVIATDADSARRIHPNNNTIWDDTLGWDGRDDEWTSIANITVELIGVATGDAKPGVVTSSFRAG